jgi:hypothetical protein
LFDQTYSPNEFSISEKVDEETIETARVDNTTEHVRKLKTLARKKTHADKIARTLKRTIRATRQKAFTLGLSLDSRA